MEEFAELIQAIKRFEDPTNMVGRNELIENLYEEMADALIDLLVEISDLRRMIDHKVWRMKQEAQF